MRLRRRFTVVEFDTGIEDILWLQLAQGEKRGLQFGVIISEEYNPHDLRVDLEPGDEIHATVESMNTKITKWKLVDFDLVVPS